MTDATGAELKSSKTPIHHMTKTGGFLNLITLLPIILCGLFAAGALAGGGVAIAKAIIDTKTANGANAAVAAAQAIRHNHEVQAQLKEGFGLYLAQEARGG